MLVLFFKRAAKAPDEGECEAAGEAAKRNKVRLKAIGRLANIVGVSCGIDNAEKDRCMELVTRRLGESNPRYVNGGSRNDGGGPVMILMAAEGWITNSQLFLRALRTGKFGSASKAIP